MYAIVDIAGQQFKVEKGQEIFVHRLQGDKGAQVGFPKVMLIENEGKSTFGTPVIEGALVNVTILEHLRADKLFVFKKKRRKGYKKFNGHRQYLSRVRVEEILAEGAPIMTKEVAEKPAPKKKSPVAKTAEAKSPVAKPSVAKTPVAKAKVAKATVAKVKKAAPKSEAKPKAPKKKAPPKE